MQNLLIFISRYGVFLTFLFLQTICLTLIVKYNNSQRAIFINSSNLATGWMVNKTDQIYGFFNIRTVADSLSYDNARLRTALEKSYVKPLTTSEEITSATEDSEYNYMPARVINNSVQLWDNKITLNKGQRDGVERGMGVINERGIVGIIVNTSDRFSQAYSVLNTQVRVSVSHEKSGQFGTLVYQRVDPRYMTLVDLPKYAEVSIGDTIVTNRFSSVFPDGVVVGTIADYAVEDGTNFYNIKVRLSHDMGRLDYVYIIDYINKKEQLELEGENDE